MGRSFSVVPPLYKYLWRAYWVHSQISDPLPPAFVRFLPSAYGPGPYGSGPLGPYDSEPFIAWKSFLSQICSGAIFEMYTLQEHACFGPGAYLT